MLSTIDAFLFIRSVEHPHATKKSRSFLVLFHLSQQIFLVKMIQTQRLRDIT